MGHDHSHGHLPASDADARRLGAAFALIVAFMAAEVVAGIVGSSLALLSDAGHMLTDAIALGLALLTQSWRLLLDRWPLERDLELPLRPLQTNDAVRVPDPRNGWSAKPSPRSAARAASARMAPPCSSGLSPSQGIEPWHERPVRRTSICMRPRWPR